ncbi:MAG: response regulator [Vicinamibacterales bacterium]
MMAAIRVLLVEDDADDAALLQAHFVMQRCPASFTRVDAADALVRALDDGSHDVVVSDHRLPGFSSLDALRLVRSGHPDMPFVILSGQIGEDLAVEALKAGADDYVMKDRLSRLVPAVQRAIADRRLRQAQRESADALRLAQAHLRWLVASSPVVVYEADATPAHALRFITENVQALGGREAGGLVGRPGEEWRGVHPDDTAALAVALERLLRTGRPERLCYRSRHIDGTYRWVQDDLRLAPGIDGGTAAIVGGLVDVTEQRALQEQAERAQRLEAMGQVAGGVAHDFNNLLAVILGCSEELLAGMGTDERHLVPLQAVRRAATRGAAVAARLLALSRRQVLKPRVRDLNDVVRDVEPLLRSVLSARVSIDVVCTATPRMVCVDDAQMEQVILNLAINARDATPRGGAVTVAVGADAHGRPTLTVSDTGAGIPPDVLPRIFEPFFTTKPPGVGTGLGLSMVHGVVTQSGGEVTVASDPGVGTRVTVALPLAAEPPAAPATEVPATTRAQGAASVLLVDDDDLVRDLVRRTLSAAGHQVETASCGLAALRPRSAGPPLDVLVTDLAMPGLGGVELARRLAARQPGLRVLFISGCPEGELPRDLQSEFLAKPFEMADLLAAMARLLGTGEEDGPAAREAGLAHRVTDAGPDPPDSRRRAGP